MCSNREVYEERALLVLNVSIWESDVAGTREKIQSFVLYFINSHF